MRLIIDDFQAAETDILQRTMERCTEVCDKLAYEWRGAESHIVMCATAIRELKRNLEYDSTSR